MTVKLGGAAGNVTLTQKMMKGDDGGYYYPSIDENSNLSWFASEEGMAAPPQSVNIAGPAGEKGEPGVYVGSEEPADSSALVWIHPQGDISENLATVGYVNEALSDYYTRTETDEYFATIGYVDDAIPDVSGYQTAAQVQTLIDNSLAAIGVAEDGEY
jgi:hypothetical protein